MYKKQLTVEKMYTKFIPCRLFSYSQHSEGKEINYFRPNKRGMRLLREHVGKYFISINYML